MSASTITASLNTSAANALVGDRSLKITSTTANDSGYFYQSVNLTKGKDYVFSAHIKADEAIINSQKAFLAVRTKNSNGADQLQYYRNAVRQESGWYLMEAAFTLPANASSTEVRLMAGLESVSGTVYYDCLQLEEGQFCSHHNLIENNDFRQGMAGFTKSAAMDMFDGVVSLNNSDTAPKTVIARGVITADVLNVRSGPGTGYAVVTSVSNGKRVNILANASDSSGTVWYYIAYSSGTAVYSGYVSSAWVRPIPSSNRVLDSAGSRQMNMLACSFGSLPSRE